MHGIELAFAAFEEQGQQRDAERAAELAKEIDRGRTGRLGAVRQQALGPGIEPRNDQAEADAADRHP
jgi:hypothetical protein